MSINARRKCRLSLVAAACVLSVGPASVLAGEITGNGKDLKDADGTLNGKSQCAFSGREDDPSDPLFKGDIAQSWGQIPKSIRDVFALIGLHPGDACNPAKSGV